MPPRIKAGDLRQPIIIQTYTDADDGVGGSTKTPATFITTRAAIWPVSGKELVKNGKETMEITHQVRTRWQAGIGPGMRVVFNSRNLEILSIVNPEERGVLVDLMCREDV